MVEGILLQLVGTKRLTAIYCVLVVAAVLVGCGQEARYETLYLQVQIERGSGAAALVGAKQISSERIAGDADLQQAVLAAYVRDAGFDPVVLARGFPGRLEALPEMFRSLRPETQRPLALLAALSYAEERARAEDCDWLFRLTGSTRLHLAIYAARIDPERGVAATLGALEYIAGGPEPEPARVARSLLAQLAGARAEARPGDPDVTLTWLQSGGEGRR